VADDSAADPVLVAELAALLLQSRQQRTELATLLAVVTAQLRAGEIVPQRE